jgi:hypothetical protein
MRTIRKHLLIGRKRRFTTLLGSALAGTAGLLTAVALAATAATPVSTTLAANGTLAAGQQIASSDGHYRVTMETNGDLVERVTGGRALWSSGTTKYPGARAVMQVNGNVVIYDAAGSAVWSSNSAAGATGCPRLVIQPDANVVDYTTKAIWSTDSRDWQMLAGDVLESGWSLYSVSPETYRLRMLTDGNLALFDGSGTELWSAKTYGHPGAYASMQTDGNLVVYAPGGHALWSSGTSKFPGAHLDMLGDGNVDIIEKSGTVAWRTGTYHKGSGVSVAPKAPAPVSCPAPLPPTPPTTTTVTTTTPVVVTVPVTTPLPTPPRRARALRVKLALSWTYNRASTRVRKVKVGTFPGRTQLLLDCKGRGCPRHSKASAKGPRGLRHLLHTLEGRRYRAGDRLLITLKAPGYRTERAEVDIRWGKKPQGKLLR